MVPRVIELTFVARHKKLFYNIINQIIKDMNIVERNLLKAWVKKSIENDEYTIAITVKLEQMDSYINYAERRMAELKAQVEVLKEVLTRR